MGNRREWQGVQNPQVARAAEMSGTVAECVPDMQSIIPSNCILMWEER